MHHQQFLKYFKTSLVLATLAGLLTLAIGYYFSHTLGGALKLFFVAAVLGVMEISLSFDNAVVNAVVLQKMTPQWQRRFLTWGIFIAVFGMRLIFPLLLVGLVAKINPIQALILAATDPAAYGQLMLSAHISVSAFGGAFLMLVALKYFFESNQHVHWIKVIEVPLAGLGRMETAKITITLIFLYCFSRLQKLEDQQVFLVAGIWGTITYTILDGLSAYLHKPESQHGSRNLNRESLGLFLYLEVLDASFSFDGVVGAFAITNNLFIIMIGLGVGAIFVRSLTVMLVDQGTMQEFRYLEHGAFYAIGILSLIMFVGTIRHIPEIFTGFIGILLIGLSLISSIHYNKNKFSTTHTV